MLSRARLLVACLGALALVPVLLAATARADSGLPVVGSGQRPGPDILYSPPATAPQLTNAPGSGWKAPPILISGAQEYRAGEYLYQGYLFDDHGGAGVPDPTSQFLSSFLFAPSIGTLTYPTAGAYANNAADLLEFRARPTPTATDFRITLNTLVDPSVAAFTIAIGASASEREWPDAAGVRSPARLFLTVHGSTASLTNAATGRVITPAPLVHVDLTRRQFTVEVRHAAWNPRAHTVRLAAGMGLWDASADHYLVPGAVATATAPGGAAPSREALFDMAFRSHEPGPDWSLFGLGQTTGDAAALGLAGASCSWRECAQADALRLGDVSQFYAEVDFGKLLRRATDTSSVPTSGAMDRIFASHFSYGQGIDYTASCGRFPKVCHGIFIGNLQPYEVYVPPGPTPPGGWGLVLQLHASTDNYNEYLNSRNELEFSARGQGAIAITPMARDPNGDYTDAAEADVFEAWADTGRHYRLDPAFTDISGYSMGGGGTYKLIERWPDLFARGFAAAAAPMDGGSQSQSMASLRNDPIMTWISSGDEGTPITEQQPLIKDLESYGLRFEFDQFLTGDHLTLATNDQYAPAAAFLGTATVDLDPAHVTYVVDPASDYPADGTVANHAYWLSGLTLASAAHTTLGTIDARSYAFPTVDPAVDPAQTTPGVLNGGYHGPMPYLQTSQTWASAQPAAPTDRLDITTANIATVTVDLARARLDCHAVIHVSSDTPLHISLPGCGTTLDLPAGTTVAGA